MPPFTRKPAAAALAEGAADLDREAARQKAFAKIEEQRALRRADFTRADVKDLDRAAAIAARERAQIAADAILDYRGTPAADASLREVLRIRQRQAGTDGSFDGEFYERALGDD